LRRGHASDYFLASGRGKVAARLWAVEQAYQIVIDCKYSEILWMGMPMSGVAARDGHAATPVRAYWCTALSVGWRLCPGAEVFGAGIPGQETLQCRAGETLAAVAGRPREKGYRLPSLAALAATAAFGQVTVTRYGKTATISAAALTCLWHSVFGTRPVTVVLIRDKSRTGYDLALVTTDPAATAAQVIERHAARWSIEVAIEDSKQVFGTGQARNRVARAVECTMPFQLACQAVATCWYATAGHHPADVEDRGARARWYRSKKQPSTSDMAAKLRRVIIAARIKPSRPDQPTCEEIHVIRPASEDLAA
jgi:hypothetical protein